VACKILLAPDAQIALSRNTNEWAKEEERTEGKQQEREEKKMKRKEELEAKEKHKDTAKRRDKQRQVVKAQKKVSSATTSNRQQSNPWPAGRSGHAMAYDPKNKVVYMHGGYDGSMH